MNETKIIWGGLDQPIGEAAMDLSNKPVDGIEIVAGVVRELTGAMDFTLGGSYNTEWYSYRNIDILLTRHQPQDFDVIVYADDSGSNHFYKLLEFAEKVQKPIVVCTPELSNHGMAKLCTSTLVIPILWDSNFFCFKNMSPGETQERALKILQAAKIMKDKPVIQGDFYNHDKISDELPR